VPNDADRDADQHAWETLKTQRMKAKLAKNIIKIPYNMGS
jgi:hypothetical protein